MGRPGQCTSVNLPEHYAILKDISGISQHLLIPTERVTGIESPSVLEPNAPEYWADGWNERKVVADSLGNLSPAISSDWKSIRSTGARSSSCISIWTACVRT